MNSANRKLPRPVARVNLRSFRVTTPIKRSEFALRNYFCAGHIHGRREGISSFPPKRRTPCLQILKVLLTGNSAAHMRPRSINSEKHIIRRPTQRTETQRSAKVALVLAEFPGAAPSHTAMACAKYITALRFFIL